MYNLTINQTLCDDQMRKMAPSIFTIGGSSKTSDKYVHIPTLQVVNGLMKEGFMPVKAMQSNSRSQERRMHTKHMIRFRHINAKQNEHGLFPELVLVNSHDGLSSYRLMAGIYRIVCTNGLIAGKTYEEVRVRHQGDVVHNVIEGSYQVMEASKNLLEHADQMSGIILDTREKMLFAEAAHAIKFDTNEEQGKAIEPAALLRPRRYQEANKSDLFTVFNIAQENIIKGGISGYMKDKNNRFKRTSTREVKSIDQNTALNRALWTLAERMAELKGVA